MTVNSTTDVNEGSAGLRGYTPGPWSAKDWRVCHSVDGDIGVICDTANNKATRTAENMANAKLIAAAPELLAVVELVREEVPRLEQMLETHQMGTVEYRLAERLLDALVELSV